MLSHKISAEDNALRDSHKDVCDAAKRINLGGTITHAQAQAIEDLNRCLTSKLVTVAAWEKMHHATFTRWAD